MSRKKELRKLSKNELIDLLLKEEDARHELEKRLEKIELYLKAFDNPHTPPSKQLKKNTQKTNEEDKENKPRFPGKPKGGNGGGVILPPPDEIVEHKLEVCPNSGLRLGKPIGYFKKTEIDFPDKPIKVIEHRIMRYVSPATGEIVFANINLPKGIYGKNIQSIVVMLKNLTNSHQKIADFMRELGAPSFSDVEVQNITNKFAEKLEAERNVMLEELRNSPYVHADETGFRIDGKNGYVWGVFTKTISILSAATSRAKINIKELLKNFKGIIVVDGYNAYNEFLLKQRCWAHLIREFKDYAEDNPEIHMQYIRLKKLYDDMKILNEKPPDERAIARCKWTLSDIVVCLKTIKKAKGLVTLIQNGGNDWFTALYYEGVPLDNNHAERELRPIVLLRKSIGCYRNEKGKKWIDNVVSVLHSWKLQGKNLFKNLNSIAC
ncbi:MAG: IS66 family transposase [Nanoarchaeota archaeon]